MIKAKDASELKIGQYYYIVADSGGFGIIKSLGNSLLYDLNFDNDRVFGYCISNMNLGRILAKDIYEFLKQAEYAIADKYHSVMWVSGRLYRVASDSERELLDLCIKCGRLVTATEYRAHNRAHILGKLLEI
jgi:hypothetical protein